MSKPDAVNGSNSEPGTETPQPTLAGAAEVAGMRRAIALSARGLGQVSPNPPVGCVLLSPTGDVIGEGWHHGPGTPHAEVLALRAAGAHADGATAVVTLEPCSHTGRTGPCTQALRTAGVARVVVAQRDPNPQAAGGADVLRAAGIPVEIGLLADEVWPVLGPWLTAVGRQRPFLTWKFAATLDGRSAAADGSSRWITSEPARHDVHLLRAKVDTVIAGVGTVLADDPALTVRLPGHSGRQPRRVIVDSHRRTPADSRVCTDRAAETWIAGTNEVGVDGDGHVDLLALFARLYADGSRWALLEGGPTLAGSALRAGLVDQVVAYIAPVLLGAGHNALATAGITSIADALRLDVDDVTQIGVDLRVIGRPSASFGSHQ